MFGYSFILPLMISALLGVEGAPQDSVSRSIPELKQVSARINETAKVADIGYGTIKVRDLTTAVSTVKIKQREIVTYSNIYDYIRGRVPGVTVLKVGQNGGKIIIRGLGSINSSTDPLMLVDGVEVTDLSYINPSDVKSIDVLKDAASCAIYGARGANGVILISTKK
ncbi:MAG: TonB-dependent receptor plug domain-containing protein [Bacteroidota bacterium]|nr:TonB-dependent receptor plug domain-containing protein [Bacteroidota bacterium]